MEKRNKNSIVLNRDKFLRYYVTGGIKKNEINTKTNF